MGGLRLGNLFHDHDEVYLNTLQYKGYRSIFHMDQPERHKYNDDNNETVTNYRTRQNS
jgi:hypothetical protein